MSKPMFIILGIFIGQIITTCIFVNSFGKYQYQQKIIKEPAIVKIDRVISNLNSGGCGFFALKLYQRIEKEKYEIVEIDNGYHIMLREKKTGLFLDSEGFHTLFDVQIHHRNKPKNIKVLTENELYNMVYKDRNWNPKFNWADTSEINKLIYDL